MKFTVNCVKHSATSTSEGKVRQRYHEFREGCSNVHNDERSGRHNIGTDNLAEYVNVKVRQNSYFIS